MSLFGGQGSLFWAGELFLWFGQGACFGQGFLFGGLGSLFWAWELVWGKGAF